ncbi:hypothetical protein [Mycoplasma suis]|uniref:DNA polymerase III delta N-terminal domain-containing protein n=2 Tax=Mycoplasma suis TaxID=57372 RepID=F0QRD1_MYCSL|nr:hypothetical protein [Mycoplasma suis]ADX98051.1 Conserved hypothetical protein [Mycoplasma suis str. Illinois]CBZ40547.1 hypothetical protein MSUIS_04540 [Mycoplasma suis KI3806]
MIWIYISRSLDALEMKIEELMSEFQKGTLLHIRRADFERVKNSLTQTNLFVDYTHFIFEDYIGKLSDLEFLFRTINFHGIKILITIYSETRKFLSIDLLNKVEDRNFWLNKPRDSAKDRYLRNLLSKADLNLSSELVSLIREESFSSCIQLRSVIVQLRILSFGDQKLSREIVLESIKSNKAFGGSDNPFMFLDLYISNKVGEWVTLLRKFLQSRESISSFLRCFSYSLSSNFWSNYYSPEISEYIRKLGYNFLIFMELNFLKILKESCWQWVVLYFFWSNRPVNNLNNNYLR